MVPIDTMETAIETESKTAHPLEKHNRKRTTGYLLLGIVFTLLLIVASSLIGVYDFTKPDANPEIFLITRVPRTVSLVLAGASMSVCGLIMQMLSQNKFVAPSTTGTTEWAALGLTLTVLIYPDARIMTKMMAASGMAFVGTMVFFVFLSRVVLRSSLIVPLVGIMMGAVVGAFTTYLAIMGGILQLLSSWFAGSFTMVLRGRYEMLWIVGLLTVVVFFVSDRFTIAGLGKEMATNVGVNYNLVVLGGTALVSMATGVTTVVVGGLPFLGLVVPNIVSMIRGDNLRTNLPWVCIGGICFTILCDIVGRVIIMPFEIPISVILGMIGAFVFITLLLRQRRHGQ